MIYQNDKLRIVPFERSKHMTEEYRSWFNDPEVTKYNSHGLFPYTPAAMDAFVKVIEQGSTSRIVWAIEVHYERPACPPGSIPGPPPPMVKDWRHIGNVSLQSINWVNRSAELAVVLGRKRGEGYGLQACEWVVDHAMQKLNLWRVWTGTAANNVGMQRVCEKLGMKHEGTFRDGMFLNGSYADIIAYGFTRIDYKYKLK